MDKKEIYDVIIKTCADVCNVSVDDITGESRKENVVSARALTTFWLVSAGFSVESIMQLTGVKCANSINSIKNKQDLFWKERYLYRAMARDVAKRLQDYADKIGESVDVMMPINRIIKRTGKN